MTAKLKTVPVNDYFLPGRILLAAGCILFFLPLLLAAAILVRCSAPGRILVTRPAQGRNGEIVAVWSFRCANGPKAGKIDRFLRVTRLESLPRLFNILRGELRFDALFA